MAVDRPPDQPFGRTYERQVHRRRSQQDGQSRRVRFALVHASSFLPVSRRFDVFVFAVAVRHVMHCASVGRRRHPGRCTLVGHFECALSDRLIPQVDPRHTLRLAPVESRLPAVRLASLHNSSPFLPSLAVVVRLLEPFPSTSILYHKMRLESSGSTSQFGQTVLTRSSGSCSGACPMQLSYTFASSPQSSRNLPV